MATLKKLTFHRWNEYRVIAQEGAGLRGGNLYTIALVCFEAGGNIKWRAGSSPKGFDFASFKADMKRYRAALTNPWLFLPAEPSKPYREFKPSVKIAACKPKVDQYNDYRMGIDEHGFIMVYQCFKVYSGPQLFYSGIQDCCTCGYTQKGFIEDALLYMQCRKYPPVDATKRYRDKQHTGA